MSFTLTMARPQANRPLVGGLALSLLAHIFLLVWWLPRIDAASWPTNESPMSRLSLRLLPPPLPRPPVKSSEKSGSESSAHQEPDAANPSPDSTWSVQPQQRTEAQTPPAIDLEGIRNAARRVGKDDALPNNPLAPRPQNTSVEVKVAKVVEASTRANCVDVYAGLGLLAPLGHAFHLLADKSDTGCRY